MSKCRNFVLTPCQIIQDCILINFSTMRTLSLRKLNQKISVIDLHLIAQITIILCSQTVIKSHQWGKYKLETQLKPFTFPQKLAPIEQE